MSNRGHFKKLAAIFLFVLSCLDSVGAQVPQRTSATYGDWTLSCVMASNGNSCGLVQVVRDKTVAAQIGIGPAPESGKMLFTVQTAANIWLATGVKLALGGDAPVLSAFFEWCGAGRCLAHLVLTENDVKQLRAQKNPARLMYKTAGQTDVAIPVTFVGFNDAINALQKK